MIIKFLGLHHPFFRPLLRRVLTLVVIAAWGAIELISGHTGWAVFALCLWLICFVAFFVLIDPQQKGGNDA